MALSSNSYFQVTDRDLHLPATIIAGSFILVALVLSFFLIFQQLRSYTNPAIISLLNPKLSLACDILRNCYEAFAFYSFGRYLVACLGKLSSLFSFLFPASAITI
ncbi:hypothetical protein IFM89_020760 [Coptis chinensis]|uniref:Uncharacterized protein n=1 Tax=Coptis chinensis TaxID=261450 RepID=A0A835IDT5_9MAGN|nr:hypothetical protein IFM89_020760 [Coptis chinensis]